MFAFKNIFKNKTLAYHEKIYQEMQSCSCTTCQSLLKDFKRMFLSKD